MKQAKLSRAEEWTDKQGTKEVRGEIGRRGGWRDKRVRKGRKRKMEMEGGEESQSPRSLMQFLFEPLNLYELMHQPHDHMF